MQLKMKAVTGFLARYICAPYKVHIVDADVPIMLSTDDMNLLEFYALNCKMTQFEEPLSKKQESGR